MGEEPKNVVKGCIRTTKGPWLVHRATKGGDVVTKYRFPSDQERQKNKQRERSRRSVTRKIFAGLKAHGNYNLPKHADSNDLLKALCEEAGWHVDEDGTVSRKPFLKMPSLIDVDSHKDAKFEDEDFCTCGDDVDFKCQGDLEIDLTL